MGCFFMIFNEGKLNNDLVVSSEPVPKDLIVIRGIKYYRVLLNY